MSLGGWIVLLIVSAALLAAFGATPPRPARAHLPAHRGEHDRA